MLKIVQFIFSLFLFGAGLFLYFKFQLIFTSLCLFLFSIISFIDFLIALIKFLSSQKTTQPKKESRSIKPEVKPTVKPAEVIVKNLPVKETVPKKPSNLKMILLQTILAGILIPQFFVYPVSFLFQFFYRAFIQTILRQAVTTQSIMTVHQFLSSSTYFFGMLIGALLVRLLFQKREALENKNYVAKSSAQLYFLFNFILTLWRFLPALSSGDLPRAFFLQFAVLPIILMPLGFYFISLKILK